MKKSRFPRIGLALGGGAVKGAAHVGVLKVLEEGGIRPQMIAGTSIGALIGTLYAFGIPTEDIYEDISQLRWSKISSFKLSKMGFLSNLDLCKVLNKWIGDAKIESARIPLAIVATDLVSGEKMVFREGPVADAVVASTCIPGFFTPVEINQRLFVDGFLVENVPVAPLREMGAEFVIAVNLGGGKNPEPPEGFFEIISRSFEIAIDQNTQQSLRRADAVIEPPLADYSRMDVEQIPDLYREGYRTAREQLPVLLDKISNSQSVVNRILRFPRLLKTMGVSATRN